MEITECLQNCRLKRKIVPDYSSEAKKKSNKNYQYQRTSLFIHITYVEKTSNFEVAPLCHTIAYNDKLLKQ